jgi:hypothetical protein
MIEGVSFIKGNRTIYLSKRYDEFRIVVKSNIFPPDILMAKIALQDLELIALAETRIRLKSLPIEVQHSTRVEYSCFDKEDKSLELEFNGNYVMLDFSSKEWEQIEEFLSREFVFEDGKKVTALI